MLIVVLMAVPVTMITIGRCSVCHLSHLPLYDVLLLRYCFCKRLPISTIHTYISNCGWDPGHYKEHYTNQ